MALPGIHLTILEEHSTFTKLTWQPSAVVPNPELVGNAELAATLSLDRTSKPPSEVTL